MWGVWYRLVLGRGGSHPATGHLEGKIHPAVANGSSNSYIMQAVNSACPSILSDIYIYIYLSQREQTVIFNLKSFQGGKNEKPFCLFVYLDSGSEARSTGRALRESLAPPGSPSLTRLKEKCFEAYVNKIYI